MEGNPEPSSFDKKRKTVEGSSSVVDASVQGKRTRESKSPSEVGVTVNVELEPQSGAQWPDYFKEVSVREGSLNLTLGTLLLSVVQGVCSALILDVSFPSSFVLYLDIQGLLLYFNAWTCINSMSQALNTVLAFCTSRKQFATSFNSLRASIEGLLKRLASFLVRLVHSNIGLTPLPFPVRSNWRKLLK